MCACWVTAKKSSVHVHACCVIQEDVPDVPPVVVACKTELLSDALGKVGLAQQLSLKETDKTRIIFQITAWQKMQQNLHPFRLIDPAFPNSCRLVFALRITNTVYFSFLLPVSLFSRLSSLTLLFVTHTVQHAYLPSLV